MIPESISTIRPLGQKLSQFFQLGWRLVSKGEVGTRQQVLTKLASEGGLRRIKELTDTEFKNFSDDQRTSVFKDSVLPFFQAISHEDVLSSLLLENSIDTIYNFLFGPSGCRAIRIFAFIAPTLLLITSGSDEILDATHIEASLAVLQKIIDLNGTALILEEFHPFVQMISECLEDNLAVAGSLSLQRAHQSLSRIRRRLGLGREISLLEVIPKAESDLWAKFEIHQDMPGLLSVEGPRHDNDHEEITKIKIMPTAQEIQSHRLEYLPIRDPAALHLPGIQGLLDRQFRLLREDTVGQLRDSVGLEIERLRNSQQSQSAPARIKHATRTVVYHNVCVVDIELDKRKGLQMVVEFDQPLASRKMTKSQRREWWTSSKQLQLDALLCLVDSEGGAIFLSVTEQVKTNTPVLKPDNRAQALLKHTMNGEDEGDMPQAKPRDLFNDPQRAFVTLCLVDSYIPDILQAVNYLINRIHSQKSLVEFPGVLLPSFRPTLQALQEMSRHGEVPFAEFLVSSPGQKEETYILPPAYALQDRFRFDISCLLNNGGHLILSPREQFDFQTLREGSTLDDAQGVALVNALCRRLALIQGPPGTGKSFTGLALIKALLKNRDKARLGPIICVCYTNHALDQLLERLVVDGIKQIVRLGSRSKSQLLEPFNLRHISSQQNKTKAEKQREWQLRSELDFSSSEVEDLLSDVKRADSWKSIKAYLEANHPRHHNELFGNDEDGFQTVHHDLGGVVSKWLNDKSWLKRRGGSKARSIQTLANASLHRMSQNERKNVYQYWVADITDSICDNLCRALNSYTDIKNMLNQSRQELDLRCLKEAHVIGVTTTGLARNMNLLRRLHSKVMLCEEAGEVLEAHTITALLPRIEHLILIGDHQQLRPQIQNYELQHENPRGEKYSLDVSLFERLVDPKGDSGIQIPFSTLEIQRRMHPSIAQLIRDTLYYKLQDHPVVSEYPEVWGLAKRLFWLDHREPEASSDPSRVMSTSHSNNWEVDMTAALVSHLVRQGKYQSDDIAVLTPYLGQLQKMRRRMSASHEIVIGDRDTVDLEKEGYDVDVGGLPSSMPQKTTLLKALRIATVDNFQGEEAKVVVISLVRSNPRNKCGFLRTSNRINVLLSRARHGMYIIGNAQTSRHVPMWAEVLSILEANNNIGRTLPLRCPRHPEVEIKVSAPDDFSVFAPEGGCTKKCNLRLSCGHSCVNKCHSEPLHDAVICLEPCQRSKPGCDHPCSQPCGQECEKTCQFKMANVRLLCGHVRANLECYKTQNLSKIRCERQRPQNISSATSLVERLCLAATHVYGSAKSVTSGKTVKSSKNTTVHVSVNVGDRITTVLIDACIRVMAKSLAHCAKRPARFDVVIPNATRGVKSLARPVLKLAPGRVHTRCQEMLSCGHQCPSICGEKCPLSEYCQICAPESVKSTMVDYIMQATYSEVDLDEDPIIVPSCGHLMALSSMDGHMRMSDYYELSEGCSVKALKKLPEPFSTENLKNCPICRGSLRDINRYNRVVRQGLIEQVTKKFISWANQQYIPLEKRLYEEEKRLQHSTDAGEALLRQPAREEITGSQLITHNIKLEKSSQYQIDTLRKFPELKLRYKPTISLKTEISKFLKQVHEHEQPFGRVLDMVQDIRRKCGITTNLTIDRTVLDTRFRMLATVLAIRCDLAILSDFVALRQRGQERSTQHDWVKAELHLDLSNNRKVCKDLIEEALVRDQPMHEVEARVFFARWSILERSVKPVDLEQSEMLLAEAKEQLAVAETTCKRYPGQTRGMLTEISNVHRMFWDAAFYTTVDNEEKRQVYAAMAREFTGTGHWYTCANGHPFTVGECGMPMQTSVCPQCNAPVGGQDHQPAAGVTHARDFEEQFGELRLN
ncbi:MAG: hypothetical protein M1816_002396 [Peltula sp. TS41687]|nr:MAG: hypothetical protein M1816_002396 [Peltula sp. TS41687]